MLKKFTAVFTAILLLLSLCACTQQTAIYEKSSFAMGSAVNVRIYGADGAQQLAQAVITAINDTDALLSANIETADIYKLNASDTGTAVSKETRTVLENCLSVCKETGAVLDITIGAVSKLWGFDTETPTLPKQNDLNKALQTVDMEKLLLDTQASTVTKAAGQEIDLGAFGKGIACMQAAQVLQNGQIPAIVSVGGTVLLYGKNPDADHWTVGIRDPKGSVNNYCATLSLSAEKSDTALVISTSGAYEKTFTQNGVTYHHILDKKTGMPVENTILSVTVIAEDGLVSDALSTVLFIHGLSEQTLAILENYRAQAVFLCKDGRMLVSDGLSDNLTLTNSDWTLGDLEDTIGGTQ